MFGNTYGTGSLFKACVRRGTCKDGCKVPSHGWTYEYSLDGKPRQKTFRDDPGKPGSGKGKAQAFAKVLIAGKVTGDTAFADTRGNVMFLDYCAAWVERGQSRNERTKAVCRSTLRRLEPKLAGRSLAWVADHRTEVEDMINSLATETAGGSYVKRARNMIVGTCKHAVRAKDIRAHNLTGLDIGKEERVSGARFYAAEHSELEILADELGKRYGLLVWIGRYGGTRLGESLGINREDIITGIDGGRVLILRRQRVADGTLDAMKARTEKQDRQIPLGDFLAARLAEAATDEQGYYFPAQARTTVYDCWKAARTRANARGARFPATFTPHALRHLYATAMLSKGARLDLISKILGHKSVEITSTVYAHWLPSDFAAIRALEMAA